MSEQTWKPIGPDLGTEYVMMRFSESGAEIVGRRSPEATFMLVDDTGASLSAVYAMEGEVIRRIGEGDDPVDEWRPLTRDERLALAESLRHKARRMRELAARSEAEANELAR